MAIVLLFGLMLLTMLMRVYMPIGQRSTGKVEKTVYLSLPERALLHRVNFYCIGGVLLMMTATGNISATAELAVIVGSLVILALPIRYVLTNEGVGINNVVFRRWSDFSGFRAEQRRIVLKATKGLRPFNLSLLGTHQGELLPVVRRHLSEARDGIAARSRGGRPPAEKTTKEPLRRKAWLSR